MFYLMNSYYYYEYLQANYTYIQARKAHISKHTVMVFKLSKFKYIYLSEEHTPNLIIIIIMIIQH